MINTNAPTAPETAIPCPLADVIDEMPWQVAGQPTEPLTEEERDARTEAYIAAARRHDAAARFAALASECPQMVDTDWTHPHFDANRAALATVADWQIDGRKGLLLTGPTGRGKTRAVMSLLRRLACDEGHDFRYWPAATWFAELQRQNRYGRDEARSWVEAVAMRRLIVLDDIGQEAVDTARSDWAQAWFFRFLDIRLGVGLPLIATTNLTARDIADVKDRSGIRADPLLRRLLDLCEVVKFV